MIQLTYLLYLVQHSVQYTVDSRRFALTYCVHCEQCSGSPGKCEKFCDCLHGHEVHKFRKNVEKVMQMFREKYVVESIAF